MDRRAGYHRARGARTAWLAGGVDLSALLPAAQARRMSLPGRFALAASRLALDEAGLPARDTSLHLRTAVVLGTAYGPASVTEQLLVQILRQGPETASPAAFAESVASAAAAQIALAFAARGPNLAVTQREASDLLALGEAARLVRTGEADRALVVVVDELTPLLHAVLDRFGALARPERDGAERARPFDHGRSGGAAAEGATALLVEPAAAAAARGCRPLVRLLRVVRGFDPSAPAWSWGGGGEALASTLRAGLARAEVEPAAIASVISGASGALAGDRLEARVLAHLFGARVPPVYAPKGAVGEAGGGHLGAAVLAAAGRLAAPTHGFARPDPDLGIVPEGVGAAPPAGPVLVSSLASGGAAAWALLAAPD